MTNAKAILSRAMSLSSRWPTCCPIRSRRIVTGLSAITCDFTRKPFLSLGSIVTLKSGALLESEVIRQTTTDACSAGRASVWTITAGCGLPSSPAAATVTTSPRFIGRQIPKPLQSTRARPTRGLDPDLPLPSRFVCGLPSSAHRVRSSATRAVRAHDAAHAWPSFDQLLTPCDSPSVTRYSVTRYRRPGKFYLQSLRQFRRLRAHHRIVWCRNRCAAVRYQRRQRLRIRPSPRTRLLYRRGGNRRDWLPHDAAQGGRNRGEQRRIEAGRPRPRWAPSGKNARARERPGADPPFA